MVLYLAKNAVPIETLAFRPSRLIVIDATWKYASEIWSRNTWLETLPIVVLPCTQPMAFSQLRRPKEEGQMSTAEAVACALQSLGCSQISTAVFHAIQFATEQELRSRAKDS